jgi:UDP-glucose:glycoprotein glucosyltransferase
MSDPDPLSALIGISQDFPKHSAAIARRVKADEWLERDVANVQAKADVKSAFWVNGRIVADKELDAFRWVRRAEFRRSALIRIFPNR